MRSYFTPRPIRVTFPDHKIIVFPSFRSTMRHFEIQNVQLQRSLDSGIPVSKGDREGILFEYAETPDE